MFDFPSPLAFYPYYILDRLTLIQNIHYLDIRLQILYQYRLAFRVIFIFIVLFEDLEDRLESASFQLFSSEIAQRIFKGYQIISICCHHLQRLHNHQNPPLQIKVYGPGCYLIAFARLLISPPLNNHQLNH